VAAAVQWNRAGSLGGLSGSKEQRLDSKKEAQSPTLPSGTGFCQTSFMFERLGDSVKLQLCLERPALCASGQREGA